MVLDVVSSNIEDSAGTMSADLPSMEQAVLDAPSPTVNVIEFTAEFILLYSIFIKKVYKCEKKM